jgi:hypothetical protein
MRIIGSIVVAAFLIQMSRFFGHAIKIHPLSFAGLITLGLMLWKLRPRWVAVPTWFAVVILQSMASAIFVEFFPGPMGEGGVLVLWPLMAYLLYRQKPITRDDLTRWKKTKAEA